MKKLLLLLILTASTLVAWDNLNVEKVKVITQEDEEVYNEVTTYLDIPHALQPTYRTDLESGALILLQNSGCSSELLISQTYNQSNKKAGLLGTQWSLNIESEITKIEQERLYYFDGYKGVERPYLKDPNSSNEYLHEQSRHRISRTDNGFIRECGQQSYHFDHTGKLTTITIKDKIYLLNYQDTKPISITHNQKPYITFKHHDRRIDLKIHGDTNEHNRSFILKQEKLDRVIYDTKRAFHYYYSDGLLSSMTYQPTDTTLQYPAFLSFDYDKKHLQAIYEYHNDQSTDTTYIRDPYDRGLYITKNMLTSYFTNGVMDHNRLSTELYRFDYYDAEQTKLKSTKQIDSGVSKLFGFDKKGRINAYKDDAIHIEQEYYDFDKVKRSTVTTHDSVANYRFNYQESAPHHVTLIQTPQETIAIEYDDKGRVFKLQCGNIETRYSYNARNRPTKIILTGKGEITTAYDEKGEITKVDVQTYDQNISKHTISLGITNAMTKLIRAAKEGVIDRYPRWLW
jgi:hypothetical protein